MAFKSDKFPLLSGVSAVGEGKCIELVYETGEHRIFDVAPYIKGSWFGELADPSYFAQVVVEPQFKEWVVWPHGQDLAPHELYELSELV